MFYKVHVRLLLQLKVIMVVKCSGNEGRVEHNTFKEALHSLDRTGLD